MMLTGLVTALRTLTILPVPGRDADRMSSALPWFPVVGMLLGGILCAVPQALSAALGEGHGFWCEGTAVVLLVAGTILTGGIHLDGLADWADGFFGARDRDAVLRIMKDSRIGSFGCIALVLVLLAKWACLARLLSLGRHAEWILAAYVVSRTAQVLLATSQPYARPEGGTAAAFVQGAGLRHAVLAMVAALILLGVPGGVDWHTLLVAGVDGGWVYWKWLKQLSALLILGGVFAAGFGMWCRRRIGGITGDTLGACSEIVETLVLAVGAWGICDP